MPPASHKRQFSISDDKELVRKVDQVATAFGTTRVKLYEIAIRKLLKNPAAAIAEVAADRDATNTTKE